MRHPKVIAWEQRLQEVFARIDEKLETKHGQNFPLHPARPPHGATATPEYDGLFEIGASFSAGFGSPYGPGYVIEIRLATLANVPSEIQQQIEKEAIALLREELPRAFPDRQLRIAKDGHIYRIIGDLRLGEV